MYHASERYPRIRFCLRRELDNSSVVYRVLNNTGPIHFKHIDDVIAHVQAHPDEDIPVWNPEAKDPSFEEVMDYRTYCETMAGLLQKSIVKLLRNLKVSRNVKWFYQEGISISGRCSLACFNGKLQ